MEIVKKNFSNAPGTFMDGVTIRMCEKVFINIGDGDREFKVKSIQTSNGFFGWFNKAIVLETCDNGKFIEIRIAAFDD